MDLIKKAYEISERIRKEDEFLVVTHIDADGITSGAIAYETLRRIGKEAEIIFLKQLDENAVERIADENRFVWLTDLGSGNISLLLRRKLEFVISDHHVPEMVYRWQLNPHDFGYDGSYDLSGSTTTYLISRCLGLNYDLSTLAIVGAVGDLQDSREAKLVGLNRFVLEEATKYGYVSAIKDLRFFGKQTRPIYKMLEYTFDPYLPGISGNERGAIEF
uniref:DHH family phosphoesterase n=1 Tax=Ferroglobus sp. TaxID=2614230 RepID=UPI0025BBED0A